jgi:hypothetical protein
MPCRLVLAAVTALVLSTLLAAGCTNPLMDVVKEIHEAAFPSDTTDPSAPGLPSLAAVDDSGSSSTDGLTDVTTGLTFSGTSAEAGSTVTLHSSIDGDRGTATADGAGGWTLDVSLPSEGVHEITVTARDAAGNVSAPSAALSVTVDVTPPPVCRILLPMQGCCTGRGLNSLKPTFTWSTSAGAASYDMQADTAAGFASPALTQAGIAGTSFTPASNMDASPVQPVGTRYYLRVRAVDAAGNASAWSTGLRYVNVGRTDGDFNGDGFADVVAGMYGYLNGAQQGRALIFYGDASNPLSTSDAQINGASNADQFGFSVASAGDVNGDGYCDVIIGAQGYTAGANTGRAYIFYGGSTVDGTADVTLTGVTAGGRLGAAVASAGDVNGDGYADVLVGAYGEGSAYIYYGGAAMNNVADVALIGNAADYFGSTVASAGDVDNDGFCDVMVGAWNNSSGTGLACVYRGGASMGNTPYVTLTGEATSSSFGVGLASGDVNGDGLSDVIVGASSYNSSQGRLYVFYGGLLVSESGVGADVKINGTASSGFGGSVSSGDVNGDGFADIVVGAVAADSSGGLVYLFHGGAAMDTGADLTFDGMDSTTAEALGRSVSVRDVNGDGKGDIIVGAPMYSIVTPSFPLCGQTYVYFGDGNNVRDSNSAGGTYSNSLFGWSVD